MKLTVGILVITLAVAVALAGYEAKTIGVQMAQSEPGTFEPGVPLSWSCAPPWEAVDFADYAAPNDAVAIETLLEASGYDWSYNLWADAAAGNFCGGAEQELVVVQNLRPYFSILRGPTPFVKATADLGSSPAHAWHAVAAGNFDLDGYQEIVAVRNVTASGVPDVFIIDVDEDCNMQVKSTRAVGSPTNSDWVDVAVGNFDGVGGQEIALVKNKGAYFVFLRFFDDGASATWSQYLTANLGSRPEYPWQALAAGDLDGVPGDELVAVRKVTDGARYTVGAYRWDGVTSNFSLFATSTFANTGNHTWISAAAGNFGGDGRDAIALVKNKHTNFVVLDYPPGSDTLRVLAGADLDTAPGQSWRGLAATDWLDGDQGYEELIAVRDLQPNPDDKDKMYQTDFFVYGNSFHRAVRAGALADTEAVSAGNEKTLLGTDPETWDFHSVEAIKAWLAAMHANTYNVSLRLPGEYEFLVRFLKDTKNFCVDGRQLRVWITLVGPSHEQFCSKPSDSLDTPWNELEYFTTDNHCTDFVGWFSLISRLAKDYRHIVAVGIDDFLSPDNLSTFTPGYVAELQSRLRWPSEWLSFVPTVYYEYFRNGQRFPDLPLTFDSMLFYFTNSKHGISAADETVLNAPEEIADMAALLPDGRSLQFGAYLSCSFHGKPSIQLCHDLLDTALAQPRVAGTTVYTGSSLWGSSSNDPDCNRPPPPAVCEAPLEHRFCAVQSVYGSH